MLEHVVVLAELAGFLAFGDQRAVAGVGEEGGNARAARTQLFGQRALRREFQLEFAGQVLALELLVFADVGGDHFLDLPRFKQQAEAEAVDARVVGDAGDALTPESRSAAISASGMPHRPKPPTANVCPSLTMSLSASAAPG